MAKKKTYFVGIDESNHGRYPEIFVGVFSTLTQDIKNSSYPKSRKKKENIEKKLGNRDYSFTLLNKQDFYRVPEKDLGGLVTSSLIKPFSGIETIKKFDIYLDGEKKFYDIEHTKEMVSNLCEISKSDISIYSGKQFDRIYYVVNLADSIAYQLFKRTSLRRKNNHKAPFLY